MLNRGIQDTAGSERKMQRAFVKIARTDYIMPMANE
jgi:hypothetical protein